MGLDAFASGLMWEFASRCYGAGNGGRVNQPTILKLIRARSVCTLSPNIARRCPKFLHTPAHEFRTKKDWSDDGGVKSEFSI
ncbi:hypothetical protein quinque_008592 [Culex quinquefasciatus]